MALTTCLSPTVIKLTQLFNLPLSLSEGNGALGSIMAKLIMISAVVGLPSFILGGTLPVIAQFCHSRGDQTYRSTLFLLGIKLAGAALGGATASFVLLPTYGNRSTLMIAVLMNAVVALFAGLLSRTNENAKGICSRLAESESPHSRRLKRHSLSKRMGAVGHCLSGLLFASIILVWFRVASPLLGDSVFTSGLLSAVIMIGLGIGGMLYPRLTLRREVTFDGLTMVTALLAVFIALPYALGDRVAYAALVLNESLKGFGLGPLLCGQFFVAALLALVPSMLISIQFGLLLALSSESEEPGGVQVGKSWFWTFLGVAAGLAVGANFLLPQMSITHLWLLVTALVAGVSALSFLLARVTPHQPSSAPWISFAALAGCLLAAKFSVGPSPAWMQMTLLHARQDYPHDSLSLRHFIQDVRRHQVAAYDSTDANNVVLLDNDQRVLLSDGKAIGSAINDAPSQVMRGVLGAILHPREIKRCCVIGLGTGLSAGWLADIPSVAQVDVITSDARDGDLAREFGIVNRNAMGNGKLKTYVGSGRTAFRMTGSSYDLITTETCSSGNAGLYTQEFYQRVKQRLNEDGLFCQEVDAAEFDLPIVKLIDATLCSEFEKVEVWNTQDSRLLYVCSTSPKPWDCESIRKRMSQPLYREACARFLRTETVEGLLGHCLANAIFSRFLVIETPVINTDDRNLLEFAALNRHGSSKEDPVLELFASASARKLDLAVASGALDKQRLAYERCDFYPAKPALVELIIKHSGEAASALRAKQELLACYQSGDMARYLDKVGTRTPATIEEKFIYAIAAARAGHPRAAQAAEIMEKVLPGSRNLLSAIRASNDHTLEAKSDALAEAIETVRKNPWVDQRLVRWLSENLNHVAQNEATRHVPVARQLFEALKQPFPEGFFGDTRSEVLTALSISLTPHERQVAIESWGEPCPFNGASLATRFLAFAEIDHPKLGTARTELESYLKLGGPLPATLEPIINALLSTGPGQEVALMREINKPKPQTAAANP